ncbi:oligosaccharide flippase family protein [Phenylobacterium kunshanense]|uniref:Polysaccharide biosynthesis protein n=1 Tax=Phenylobacterium kunshanense TaxID=1445034 RepID=A0A328BKS2_9CAUL|nr:oligosaccharide flippase family protein [Phenylobacterium kunshanense]RAK66544.1 polysaccharide biosynthesis protein [Phenylobacterium kunshanense]
MLGRQRRGKCAAVAAWHPPRSNFDEGQALTETTAGRGRRGAKLFLVGSLTAQACALLRYTILARLLGPEQLGLVAVLTLATNFFEMISDTGADRFLVQDRDGDKPEVQSLVQLVFALRGLFMAIGLALAAWPIAAWFGEPALIVGLAVLGFAPLIGGLLHLDLRRLQRTNDFRIEGRGMVASELLGLAATLVAAFATRDYTAVLYGLITRSLVLVVVSHIYAERAYRWAWPAEHVRRLRTFAIPLIINGVLLFAASQSDRMMISGLLGLEALGRYTAILLLVLYPSMAISRFVQGIHLPLVAKDPLNASRAGPADLLGGQSLLLALGMIIGFAVVAPPVVPLLFGHEFQQAAWLIALIGVLQGGRFLRVWTVTLALGIGQSRIVTANTLARALGIPAAALGYALIGGVAGVVSGFIFGELAALVTGVLLLNRARNKPAAYDFDRIVMFASGSVIVLALTNTLERQWTWGLAVLIPAAIAFTAWTFNRERETVRSGLELAARMLKRAK